MRNKIIYSILLILSLSIFTHCNKTTWLMQGVFYAEGPKLPRGIEIDTKHVYFPASTMVDALYQVDENKTITLIIAASIHMNGWVSVLDGGLNSQHVKVQYRTKSGKPDIFFVMIQSTVKEAVAVKDTAQ